jgi:hypothetical protein
MGQWVNGQIVARLNRVNMPVTPFPSGLRGLATKRMKYSGYPWRVHFFADFARCGSLKELSAIDVQESSLSINNHCSHANQKPTILQALSHGA